MFRQILIFISAIGFWMPAVAQDKVSVLPKNTVDCKQFKRTGPKEWIEVGTAVFDLGEIKDINLTDQPVTPGYFKFGGIDLYPVLEGKCSDHASNTAPVPQPALMAAGPIQKEELDPSRDAAKAGQLPAQPGKDQGAPTSVSRKADLESERESGSCPSKKLVYAANGPGGIESDASVIELVFESEHKEDLETAVNSEFEIREYRNDLLGWTYKGKFLQKEAPSRFGFPLFQPRRRRNPLLEPHYIKPNRDGTGEPILYVAGLHKLSASKRMDAPPRLKASARPKSCLKSFISIAASDAKPLLGFELLPPLPQPPPPPLASPPSCSRSRGSHQGHNGETTGIANRR